MKNMIKVNRIISVPDEEVEKYKASGYSVLNPDGSIDKPKTQTENELRAEIEAQVRAEVEVQIRAEYERKYKLSGMTIEELKKYASEKSIIIGNDVTKKDDIISLILEHEQKAKTAES